MEEVPGSIPGQALVFVFVFVFTFICAPHGLEDENEAIRDAKVMPRALVAQSRSLRRSPTYIN